MKDSSKARMLIVATTLAILLANIPCAQAGNGWGWKKPMNQKGGAFYTSNKAFKRTKSSSSSYRRSTSYPRYTVTPVHSQPPSRSVTVQPAPVTVQPAPVTQQPASRLQAPVRSQPAAGQVQSTPVQAQPSPTPAAVPTRVSPSVTAPGTTPNAKAVQKETKTCLLYTSDAADDLA